IRKAGVDVIYWNFEEEQINYTRSNEALNSKLCFVKNTWYQSAGNRIFPIDSEGNPALKFNGITDISTAMHFDDKQGRLWIASGKKTTCFDKEGNPMKDWDGGFFVSKPGHQKILIKSRAKAYAVDDYSWIDIDSFQQTRLMSESLRGLDFDNEHIISTESYFSRSTKKTKLRTHNGNLLQEVGPKKSAQILLLGDGKYVTADEKTLEYWDINEKSSTLKIKGANSYTPKMVKHHSEEVIAMGSGSEIKLWRPNEETPCLHEFLWSETQTVLMHQNIEEFIIVCFDAIYTLHPKSFELKLIGTTEEQRMRSACVDAKGRLLVCTEAFEILDVDLKSALSISKGKTNKAKKDFNLKGIKTQKDLLAVFEKTDWANLSQEQFLAIRKTLQKLEKKEGLSQAHYHFTESLLASKNNKGVLRHDFAQVEEITSAAISNNGKYLVVGTWVGEDYQTDGSLQFWDMSTGKCVNMLKDHFGGIGWPDYPNMIQWENDDSFVGAAINTNSVAKIDPYSLNPNPITEACVTNGWSRPPAWSWKHDSKDLIISCWHESEIPACIAQTETQTVYEDDAKWFSKKITEDIKQELHDELQSYDWCNSSEDGKLIFGYNRHNQVYAIDVSKKQISWLKNVSGKILFHKAFWINARQSKISLFEITSGALIKDLKIKHPVQELIASSLENVIALVGKKSITILRNGLLEKPIQFESNIKSFDDESDFKPVALNPEGNKLAVMLENGSMKVFDFEQKTQFEFECEGDGVFYGDSVATISEAGIWFYKENGALISRNDKESQAEAYNELYDQRNPLFISKKDYSKTHITNPLYALMVNDESKWCVVLPTGLIIVPKTHRKELLESVSLAFDCRYSWPIQWLNPKNIYESLEEAKEDKRLGLPAAAIKSIKPKGKPRKKGIQFEKIGSIDDIIDVHQKSLKDLSSGWHYHVTEHNGKIASKLVEKGEFERALEIATNCKEWYLKVSNLGFLGLQIHNKGNVELAEKAFELGLEALNSELNEGDKQWAYTFVFAPLGALAEVLGKKKLAKEYLKKAEVKLNDESNRFEKHACLAKAYLRSGHKDKAIEIMNNGPWSSFLTRYQEDYILELFENNFIEDAFAYADLCKEKSRLGSWDLLFAGFDRLLDDKAYNKAIEWMQKFEGLSTTSCEEKLIERLIKNQEAKFAKNYLEQELKDCDWLNTKIRLISDLARVDTKSAREWFAKIKPDEKPYYAGEYCEHLGNYFCYISDFESPKNILSTFKDEELKLSLLQGLLVANQNDPAQDLFLQTAVDVIQSLNFVGQKAVHNYIKLIGAAKALKNTSLEASLKVLAAEKAEQSKNEKERSFSELESWYLDLDMPGEAYTMFKKQTPANRKYKMKDFALKVAELGYWKSAAELLETIPAKDLNDRPNAAMAIIENLN
ncbi:MAG: WD40 repeat domain-containing protein, partial [Flavobacteriales bacterium]|nr:WD40 repeat domain-containing protein [Flavobacteriales bacterium]